MTPEASALFMRTHRGYMRSHETTSASVWGTLLCGPVIAVGFLTVVAARAIFTILKPIFLTAATIFFIALALVVALVALSAAIVAIPIYAISVSVVIGITLAAPHFFIWLGSLDLVRPARSPLREIGCASRPARTLFATIARWFLPAEICSDMEADLADLRHDDLRFGARRFWIRAVISFYLERVWVGAVRRVEQMFRRG